MPLQQMPGGVHRLHGKAQVGMRGVNDHSLDSASGCAWALDEPLSHYQVGASAQTWAWTLLAQPLSVWSWDFSGASFYTCEKEATPLSLQENCEVSMSTQGKREAGSTPPGCCGSLELSDMHAKLHPVVIINYHYSVRDKWYCGCVWKECFYLLDVHWEDFMVESTWLIFALKYSNEAEDKRRLQNVNCWRYWMGILEFICACLKISMFF